MSATATVRIRKDLLEEARLAGKIEHRRPAQQIEYWVEIGKCMIDNPDLTLSEIQDILRGVQEIESGMVSEYSFG